MVGNVVTFYRSVVLDTPYVEEMDRGTGDHSKFAERYHTVSADPHYIAERKPEFDSWDRILDGIDAAHLEGRQPIQTGYSDPGVAAETSIGSQYFKKRQQGAKKISSDLNFEVLPSSLEEDGDMLAGLVRSGSERGADIVIDLYGHFSPAKGCYKVREYPAKRIEHASPEFLAYFREEKGTTALEPPKDQEEADFMKKVAALGVLGSEPVRIDWAA